jgi:hypothetical protein
VPEPTTSAQPAVHQLRVVLRGISPLFWRRLLVCRESTIADMHSTLRTAFGWNDEHVNRFVIYGREDGVPRIDGIRFADDAHQLRPADFVSVMNGGDSGTFGQRCRRLRGETDPRRRAAIVD